MDIKNVRRTSLAAYSSPSGTYTSGQRAWAVDTTADIALPCATQVWLRHRANARTSVTRCDLDQTCLAYSITCLNVVNMIYVRYVP
jgi:hypothetical protein